MDWTWAFLNQQQSLNTKKYQLIGNLRYINDILTAYDRNKTNTEQPLNKLNVLQPLINCSIEKETQSIIHIRRLKIHRENNKLTWQYNENQQKNYHNPS